MGRSKKRKIRFDITVTFSIIFILICLFAVWSLKEVGKDDVLSQPQIPLDKTSSTLIYEPLKPLSEEDSIKKETSYKNEVFTEDHKTGIDTTLKVQNEVYDDIVDVNLKESIKSFFLDLGCKVEDDWVIDLPTFYSVEWLKRRLNMKISELGYNLKDSIVYKDDKELLKLKFEKVKPKGRISIIIDDVGRSTRLNGILESIDLPINISILPRQGKSKDMSIVGMRKCWDVLLHLPMEPKEKSWVDSTFIKVAMDDKEIEKMIDSYLQALPYVNGVNNHMGSLAITDERVMEIVLSIIKNRGMYFIDSLTTSDSVGEKISREIGLKRFAKRDIFLDNIDDRNYIETQIDKLIEVSIRKGFAIGIGHLRENTLLAIKDYNWKDKGIELVLLSEVL